MNCRHKSSKSTFLSNYFYLLIPLISLITQEVEAIEGADSSHSTSLFTLLGNCLSIYRLLLFFTAFVSSMLVQSRIPLSMDLNRFNQDMNKI
jgi:hypothetical protein